MKKNILIIPLFLFVTICNAQNRNDILVQIDGLKITQQMLMDDINAMQDIHKEQLLSNTKQLNEYIDIYYREKLFERLALQQKIDQQPNYQALLKAAKRRLLVNLLIEKKKRQIVVPDMTESAKEYYRVNKDKFQIAEKIEVRHILLKSSQDNPDKMLVKQRLKNLLEQIKNNPNSFDVLAKKYSEDKGSAGHGGALAAFSKGRMVAEFEREAFKLTQPNQLSEVFNTKYGYHIIQLIKRIPAYIAPFEQVKLTIIDKLAKDYTKEAYMHWRNKAIDPKKAIINHEKLKQFVQELVNEKK